MFKCIAGIITEDNVVIICSLCVGGKAFILVLLLQNVLNYLVFVDVYTQGVWGGVCFGFYCYFFKGVHFLSGLETTGFLLNGSDACGGIHPR